MLTVKEIYKKTDFGGTAPVIIIASDNNPYILKFRMSEEGMDIQNFNEYLGYGLSTALKLSISPQKLHIIDIDDQTLQLLKEAYNKGRITPESYNFALASKGKNICIEYLNNIVKAEEITNETFLSKVRFIDNVLMNRDRNKYNPNILKHLTKEIYYAIDYGLSLLDCRVYEALEYDCVETYSMVLQTCDALEYKFYDFKGTNFKPKLDTKEFQAIIEEIINSMPSNWKPLKHKDYIVELICSRFANKKSYGAGCPVELYR